MLAAAVPDVLRPYAACALDASRILAAEAARIVGGGAAAAIAAIEFAKGDSHSLF